MGAEKRPPRCSAGAWPKHSGFASRARWPRAVGCHPRLRFGLVLCRERLRAGFGDHRQRAFRPGRGRHFGGALVFRPQSRSDGRRRNGLRPTPQPLAPLLVATFLPICQYLVFTEMVAMGRIPPSLEPFLICRSIKSVPRVPQGRAAVVKDDRLQQQGVLNVKKSSLVAVLATCAAGGLAWMSLAGSPVLAQQGPPTGPASSIALIDMGLIFKEHDSLQGRDGPVADGRARAEAEVKKATDDLQIFDDSLKEFTPGSDGLQEHREGVHPPADRVADAHAKGQKQEFMLPRGGHL